MWEKYMLLFTWQTLATLHVTEYPPFFILFKTWLKVFPGRLKKGASTMLDLPLTPKGEAPWYGTISRGQRTEVMWGEQTGVTSPQKSQLIFGEDSPFEASSSSCSGQVGVAICLGVPLWHPLCTWVWVPVASSPGDHPGLPTTDHTLPPRKTWISLKVYRFSQTSSNNSHGRTLYTWGWSLNFLSLLFPCHTDYIHNLISSYSILKWLIF